MGNRIAVVTGASRGIGKQLCVDLARAGYDVVCVARSSAESPSKLPGTIDATASAVEAAGARALPVELDVRDEAGVASLAERVTREWGVCDFLVNNAAVAPPRLALEDSTKRWRLAMDVNVNGPFYLMYYFCPSMLERGSGGRVLNVSSKAAVDPGFGRASYTASKRALEGLTEVLAVNLAGQVAVNGLRIDVPVYSEGFTDTLAGEDRYRLEHPVVISDAVLWIAERPLDESGEIYSVRDLRERGIVRQKTLMDAGAEA